MPLATRNGQLIVKDGKLAENCNCCGGGDGGGCPCKSNWCCNAPTELFATLSFTGGKRQSQKTFGTLYTISLDIDPTSASGTYTLTNKDSLTACGLVYDNLDRTVATNDISTWTTVPQIQVVRVQPNIVVNLTFYFASGSANYKGPSYLQDELNRPFIILMSAIVPEQQAAGAKYPCELWGSLGEISSQASAVSARNSDKFNYWSNYTTNGSGSMPAWSPDLTATVSFSV